MIGATLFSGFEGAGLGMIEAAITHAWGIESDPEIGAVARRNGFDVTIANILGCDPSLFPAVDVLHASPPCPSFSVASANGSESEHDVALARKVAQFIDVLRPKYFSLENVYLYRRSASWEIIRNTLYECGYWMDLAHVNAADFSVPQTRKRMIVRAIHGAMVPHLPPARPWRGWYEAIEDLIPHLPDSQFARWQLKRLPTEVKTLLWSNQRSYDQNGNEYGAVTREAHEPAMTVRANHNSIYNAFIMSGQNSGQESRGWGRWADEPYYTVTATVKKGIPRAWIGGEVKQINTRALARFQSFPDSYELPDVKVLACRGIGNACPPLLMQRIYEGLVR